MFLLRIYLLEFGSFTVGESGAVLYSIQDRKTSEHKEEWHMIDSSFITTLPDEQYVTERSTSTYVLLKGSAENESKAVYGHVSITR